MDSYFTYYSLYMFCTRGGKRTRPCAIPPIRGAASRNASTRPHGCSRRPAMINILTNAPTWAWLVLSGLIVLGGLQTMPRRLPLAMIVVLPVAMTALSLYSVG